MSEQQNLKTHCLIIGSGPAGYTAAIYTSRANLSPILVEGLQPGGQLTTTTEVENFPGYPEGITGPEMMLQFRTQCERFGTQIKSGFVTEIDFSKRPYVAQVDGGAFTITADTIIIATGATAKYLGLPDEEKYNGLGVSACATCDGFFYRGKDVAVVGGGDTACEEALYLSTMCNKVYLIVRKNYLRASQVMQDRVRDNDKVEVLFEHNTVGLFGDGQVEGAHLLKRMGTPEEEKVDIKIDGFFLAIGHKPNTEIFKGHIDLDPVGYIVTKNNTTETNMEGIFAAGDVADPRYRQAVTAAGSGCRAAIDVEKYVNEHIL